MIEPKIIQTTVKELGRGAVVVYEGELWMVRDVRQTAMTSQTNEVWMMLEDRHGNQPLVDQDMEVTAVVMVAS